jgi:type I restriction enzyme S subunit
MSNLGDVLRQVVCIPSTIPNDWSFRKLTDICSPKQWRTISSSEMTTSGYPVFGANGFVGFFHEYNHEDETVAITCRGNTCGTINRIPPKTYITGNSMALDNIKSREVSQNYLYYALKYRGVGDSISGSAQPQITGAGLRAVEFPAPPLPEQQKIAAILSSVDDVIEKTRAQIDKLKDLKSGMMQELLTRGIGSGGVPHTDFKDSPVGRIPVSWRVAKLAQVTKVVDSLHQTPTFANDGFPMIRVSDIKPGKVNTERAFKVSQEVFNQFTKNHKPQKSDLLMSRVGSYGVCCYLNRDIDVCLGQNTVVIIPDRIDSLFLYHSIYSEAVQNQIEFEVAGSGYKSLSLASIRSLSIPLPPDDEQKQIADILVSIDDQIEVKNRKLKAVSNAKKALMQDLLTGKVRVNIDQKESAVA